MNDTPQAPQPTDRFAELRAALAELETPIGNMVDRAERFKRTMNARNRFSAACNPDTIKALLDAASLLPAPVPLTRKEILACFFPMEGENQADYMEKVGRAIEAAHGIGTASTSEPAPQAIGEVNCIKNGMPVIRLYPCAANVCIGAQVFVGAPQFNQPAPQAVQAPIDVTARLFHAFGRLTMLAHGDHAFPYMVGAPQNNAWLCVRFNSYEDAEEMRAALKRWHEAARLLVKPDNHPAEGCSYCKHPLYAGLRCKNCGRASASASDAAQTEDRKLLEQALAALAAAGAVMGDVLGCAVPHEKVCDALAALRVRLGKESGNGN
jgi:hypothetical protein